MKNIRLIYQIMAIMMGMILAAASCQKDNYTAPQTRFTGHLVYKGNPIRVKNTGLTDGNGIGAVYFELWQDGFGKSGAIDVYLDQDGSFSALLYNGDYKLVIPSAQGPFISLQDEQTGSDTTILHLNGNTDMDIEVLPYYMIDQANFTVGADSIVKASAAISKVITDSRAKDIEFVGLYVNRTSFVDEDNNIAKQTIAGSDLSNLSSIALQAKIPEDISGGNIGVADQNYFYARVGVKIEGVDDMIFSDIIKVELP
ncbi:Protein of unknown function [Arachidicoccus rhizosphaerae]|uniref:DUF3823 domain-containing protein n=1 Tax=Arachidicoccus rhizosphaerae TaxID=551991 RepID=A0A1H4AIL3_9BACT|nr:DUF3823 domain-containing protein [Arachidicoccus rhizosphaerae]SEA35687.1 Protein of unknown function [Arachidicoccus rhizosphaerae]